MSVSNVDAMDQNAYAEELGGGLTASSAYSTWKSRPCGLQVVTSVSYWSADARTIDSRLVVQLV